MLLIYWELNPLGQTHGHADVSIYMNQGANRDNRGSSKSSLAQVPACLRGTSKRKLHLPLHLADSSIPT